MSGSQEKISQPRCDADQLLEWRRQKKASKSNLRKGTNSSIESERLLTPSDDTQNAPLNTNSHLANSGRSASYRHDTNSETVPSWSSGSNVSSRSASFHPVSTEILQLDDGKQKKITPAPEDYRSEFLESISTEPQPQTKTSSMESYTCGHSTILEGDQVSFSHPANLMSEFQPSSFRSRLFTNGATFPRDSTNFKAVQNPNNTQMHQDIDTMSVESMNNPYARVPPRKPVLSVHTENANLSQNNQLDPYPPSKNQGALGITRRPVSSTYVTLPNDHISGITNIRSSPRARPAVHSPLRGSRLSSGTLLSQSSEMPSSIGTSIGTLSSRGAPSRQLSLATDHSPSVFLPIPPQLPELPKFADWPREFLSTTTASSLQPTSQFSVALIPVAEEAMDTEPSQEDLQDKNVPGSRTSEAAFAHSQEESHYVTDFSTQFDPERIGYTTNPNHFTNQFSLPDSSLTIGQRSQSNQEHYRHNEQEVDSLGEEQNTNKPLDPEPGMFNGERCLGVGLGYVFDPALTPATPNHPLRADLPVCAPRVFPDSPISSSASVQIPETSDKSHSPASSKNSRKHKSWLVFQADKLQAQKRAQQSVELPASNGDTGTGL